MSVGRLLVINLDFLNVYCQHGTDQFSCDKFISMYMYSVI